MADTHDWHTFDAELGLEVRQTTGGDQANRWEVRRASNPDVTAQLDDAGFDRLRSDPGWLPEELR